VQARLAKKRKVFVKRRDARFCGHFAVAVVLLAVAGCSGSAPSALPTAEPTFNASNPAIRVLFLGNSHTATNDVPGLVRAMAAAGGVGWSTGR
jgi:hypothetical protein